jgi:hypothetical protein
MFYVYFNYVSVLTGCCLRVKIRVLCLSLFKRIILLYLALLMNNMIDIDLLFSSP